MKILGFEISRKKAASLAVPPNTTAGGWWTTVFDRWPGAWQQQTEYSRETILAYHAVYACITLIANDIGKLRPKLVRQNSPTGIWYEVTDEDYSPLLAKPNNYQNHIQFKEWSITSKLLRGNSYALKVRNAQRQVIALYILDPTKVTPLVTPEAEVYYQLTPDNMADLQETVTVPASEIIHDRMNCLFHPLIGVSPIYACGSAATTGLSIQDNSQGFFANASVPGGILVAPGAISQQSADALKAKWESEYAGDNSGKIAVLGDGLAYTPMRMTSVDAQLIEQLKWTAEVVCSTFHVPPFKIGVGAMPTYQNAEILNQIYYSDCLQSLIEQYELCMDSALGLDMPTNGSRMGVELDLRGLLRMDTSTLHKTLTEDIKGALLTPNEARREIDKPPLEGGDTIYLQQQYYSLEALAERDANEPFAKPAEPAPAVDSVEIESETEDAPEEKAAAIAAVITPVLTAHIAEHTDAAIVRAIEPLAAKIAETESRLREIDEAKHSEEETAQLFDYLMREFAEAA